MFTDLVIEPCVKLQTIVDEAPKKSITNKEKLAHLTDAVTCSVTEERNGAFTLEMQYPVAGQYFSEIAENLIIKAKPNKTDENQYFRIKNISKPIDGLITVYANHISYDLSGYPVKRFKQEALNCSAAISGILGQASNNIGIENPFRLSHCDITTLHSLDLKAVSARAALGGTEGSILQTYGGEFKFDNYQVNLYRSRGADNGVRISYGKNLVGLDVTIDTDSAYTGLFPYAYGDNESYVSLPEGTLYVNNDSGVAEKILILDFSNMFPDGTEKTVDNLRELANEYLDAVNINEVTASMKVEMLDLSKAKSFDYQSIFESVNLCDTVHLTHKKLGVSASLKVVMTKFNVLSERYDSLELGTIKSGMSDIVAQTSQNAGKAIRIANEGVSQLAIEFQNEIDEMSNAITGASGGHVVLNPSKNPQEILILCDSDEIESALNLWRWNSAGLAYGSHGYDGKYDFSILGSDGKLIINEATAALINANLIRAGSILSADRSVVFNLDGNYLDIGTIQGKTRQTGGHIDFYYDDKFSYRIGQTNDRDFTIETFVDNVPTPMLTIDPNGSFRENMSSATVFTARNGLALQHLLLQLSQLCGATGRTTASPSLHSRRMSI